MLTETTIHPASFLGRLCHQDPLMTTTGKELLRQLPSGKAESLPIGMTEERLPDERYQHFLFACLVELNPYPQTFGSFLTWYYTLNGTTIDTDIVKHVTLDIGGGQLHTCTVSIEHQTEGRPRLRMEAAFLDERLTENSISV